MAVTVIKSISRNSSGAQIREIQEVRMMHDTPVSSIYLSSEAGV